MITVSASEFQRTLGAVSDTALREAVTITKQGRNHLVLLSYDEYVRLLRRDRKVGLAADLPDQWLNAVRTAEAPAIGNDDVSK
ncbi:MAG: type II toxin-antitoxin system Phd/YefM family antitoxin [Hyphomicrobium aestuarii]|nr:type II toxin-antitoxin system Phd/YefM family antitoxin [Hyphomicrobium aestuarii]